MAHLKAYAHYLKTPHGGKKSNKSIRLTTQQIFNITKQVGGDKCSMDKILDKDLVYKTFFERQLKERENGGKTYGLSFNTLNSYSYSLQTFLVFLKGFGYKYSSKKQMKRLKDVIDVNPKWRHSWKKEKRIQNNQRDWQQVKTLVTPQQIQSMLNCKHAVYLEKMLRGLLDESATTEHALQIRNHIAFQINVENANRAEIIQNMTTAEVMEPLESQKDHVSIMVSKHKTSATYGGSVITRSTKLYMDLVSFIESIRPLFSPPETNNKVFTSAFGDELDEGIHRLLKSYAQKTGVLSETTLASFSSTMIRKATVSNTRHLTSPEKNILASLMAHSRKTADSHYHIQNKVRTHSDAHKTVKKLLTMEVSILIFILIHNYIS